MFKNPTKFRYIIKATLDREQLPKVHEFHATPFLVHKRYNGQTPFGLLVWKYNLGERSFREETDKYVFCVF